MKQRTDRFPGAWLLACAAIFLWTDRPRAEPPYPPSPVVAGIDWQFDSLDAAARLQGRRAAAPVSVRDERRDAPDKPLNHKPTNH